MSAELHVTIALTRCKAPHPHRCPLDRRLGGRDGEDKNPYPCRESNSRLPARSLVINLSCPGLSLGKLIWYIFTATRASGTMEWNSGCHEIWKEMSCNQEVTARVCERMGFTSEDWKHRGLSQSECVHSTGKSLSFVLTKINILSCLLLTTSLQDIV